MKRFIIKTLFYFIPFICILGYYKFIIRPNISGDIGALGQISFSKSYNEYLEQNYLTDNLAKDTLIVSYEKFYPSKTPKIFTIGSSFSQKKIYGYQNYLAHILNDSIINIERNGSNFETTISLLNSGFIDSSNCKLFILEQVDRGLIWSLDKIDFKMQYKLPQKNENQTEKDTNEDSELYGFASWIRLRLGYDNPISNYDLKQDCFTHNHFSHKLFCYHEDIYFDQTKPADIEKAKENLILLNNKFAEKGIKLIFLIAADKYDVYRPFMTNESLPIDTTTDGLSNLSNIHIINTKPILQEMVRNGEKDVYMVNDTHWSYKASEAVAEKIADEINALN